MCGSAVIKVCNSVVMTSITVMLVVHFGKSFVHYSEREEAYKQRKWEEKVNRKKKV